MDRGRRLRVRADRSDAGVHPQAPALRPRAGAQGRGSASSSPIPWRQARSSTSSRTRKCTGATSPRSSLPASNCHPSRPCESGYAPSGSTAGRASSPASFAQRSISSAMRPSSSADRRRRASRCRRRPGRTTSGPRTASLPRRTSSSRPTSVGWAKQTGIDVCFFDQNYEFDAVAALRGSGVRTIGRFVWERLQRRARRADEALIRPRLLADPRRTGALRRDGHRDPVRPIRSPSRSTSRSRRIDRAVSPLPPGHTRKPGEADAKPRHSPGTRLIPLPRRSAPGKRKPFKRSSPPSRRRSSPS